jgi:hypothetical protein
MLLLFGLVFVTRQKHTSSLLQEEGTQEPVFSHSGDITGREAKDPGTTRLPISAPS